jgi:hypothetical protein
LFPTTLSCTINTSAWHSVGKQLYRVDLCHDNAYPPLR